MNKSDKRLEDLLFPVLVFLIYIVFVLIEGVKTYPDTQGYIDMNLYREPLYPSFLAAIRMIFPDNLYLNVVIIVQALFISYATCSCYLYLKRQLKLTGFFNLLVLGSLFLATLVDGMLASGKCKYVNTIQSEGIAIALWFLFWRYIVEYIIEGNKRSEWVSYGLSLLLMLTRSQMKFTLLIWVIVIGTGYFSKHQKIIKYANILFRLVMGFALVMLLGCTYNLVVNGIFVDNIAGNDTKVTHVLYVSNKADADVFEDEDIKRLYLEILEKIDAGKALDDYSGKGLYSRALHMETYHDFIKYECMDPLVRQYVLDHEGNNLTETEMNASMNSIFNIFISKLLFIHLKEWIYGYFSLAFIGFVRTVAFPRLFIYAILIYIIYSLLLIYCIKKKKNKHVIYIAAFSLLCIVANVSAVSLFIMCMNRFMLYNRPFFYISLLLMVREVLDDFKRETKSGCVDTMLQRSADN